MTRSFTGVAIAALIAAAPALADTSKQMDLQQSAEQPANSGPGVQGPPDTRTGPATRAPGEGAQDAEASSADNSPSGNASGSGSTAASDGTSGNASSTENTTQPSQDSSGVKGLPGNKSGSSARTRSDRMETEPAMREEIPSTAQLGALAQDGADYFVTEDLKKEWIGKSVYSSEGENLGEIADVKTDTDNKVTDIQADIGGFLGLGETRVSVGADKIQEVKDDSIVLKLKAAEINNLRPIGQ